MKKKKLLITTDCFLPRWDGIARFLSELLPYLKKEYAVTVVAPHFEGTLPALPGITVVRVPLLNIRFGDIYFSWFPSKTVKRFVQENDLVFNQTLGPIGMVAIRAAHKQKKPIISYVHSVEWELAAQGYGRFKNFLRWSVRTIARWLYNQCSLLLVPSKDMEDILTANKIHTRKEVVPLGIDTGRFIPPLSKALAKKRLGISPRKFVVGYHGRIGREKNLPTLATAFKQLRQPHPNLQLLIVGKGVESEIKQDKDILLPGAVNNVVQYLQAMDVFVLPSLTETSSLATMEAMSTGLPVVVTPVGSIREYVVDGENGLIFPRQDVASLAEKLELLIHDEKLRAKLGKNARKTIIEKHHWQKTVKRILAVLRAF